MKVLITGANRGIGLSLAKSYQSQGATVIAMCRNESSELRNLVDTVITNVELSDSNSISKGAEAVAAPLDLVIHCAGIMRKSSLEDIAVDDAIAQFRTNSIAPLELSQALLPKLSKEAKIAIITSRMGSVADNDSGGSYGYRMSKAAVNAAGKSLAIDLAPKGIAVGLFHPGYVRTDMTGGNGLIDADESAKGLVAGIENLKLDNSGGFWHQNGEVLPW